MGRFRILNAVVLLGTFCVVCQSQSNGQALTSTFSIGAAGKDNSKATSLLTIAPNQPANGATTLTVQDVVTNNGVADTFTFKWTAGGANSPAFGRGMQPPAPAGTNVSKTNFWNVIGPTATTKAGASANGQIAFTGTVAGNGGTFTAQRWLNTSAGAPGLNANVGLLFGTSVDGDTTGGDPTTTIVIFESDCEPDGNGKYDLSWTIYNPGTSTITYNWGASGLSGTIAPSTQVVFSLNGQSEPWLQDAQGSYVLGTDPSVTMHANYWSPTSSPVIRAYALNLAELMIPNRHNPARACFPGRDSCV
jgi:hypothetical protein